MNDAAANSTADTSLALDQIYQGDAPSTMARITPDSVALSVWSPPYFVGKKYEEHLTFETWQDLLKTTIEAHLAVLKPGGFMAINIGDILAFRDESMPRIQAPNTSKLRSPVTRENVLDAKAKHPEFNRNQLAELLGCSEQTVDRRLNGNNIRGGKYQAQTRVFLVGHLLEKYAYDAGLYLYDRRVWVKDPAWRNSQWHSSSYRAVDEFEYIYIFWKPGETIIDRNRLIADEWTDWGSRAVWSFPSVRSNDSHEAMFPIELPRRVIKLLTEEGDLVLDPFVGSGTSCIAAMQLGRKYIGIDLHEDYVSLARRSLQDEKDRMGYLFEVNR